MGFAKHELWGYQIHSVCWCDGVRTQLMHDVKIQNQIKYQMNPNSSSMGFVDFTCPDTFDSSDLRNVSIVAMERKRCTIWIPAAICIFEWLLRFMFIVLSDFDYIQTTNSSETIIAVREPVMMCQSSWFTCHHHHLCYHPSWVVVSTFSVIHDLQCCCQVFVWPVG